jgi:hypothetical protein
MRRREITMTDDEKLQAATDQIAAVLASDTKRADVRSGDLCKTYHDLKPGLEIALSILEKLPFPAVKTVIRAVRLLMTLADQFCPA